MADLDGAERRGWLSHCLAAIAVSALGLAVAGSLPLTTSAQTIDKPAAQSSMAPQAQFRVPTAATSAEASPSVMDSGTLTAFKKREAVSDTSRSSLRSAQVAERAAARAENLLKTAESVTRAARAESSKSRSKDLQASDRAARENAVRLATEARQRAAAARLAAEVARRTAEAAERAASERQAASVEGQAASVQEQPAPESQNTPPAPARPPASSGGGGGGSASPVPGAVIGARFGQVGLWSRYHTGLDFRAGYGVPIRAVKSGVVLYAGNVGNWAGNHVAVKHGDGMTTMSSHMSSMAVRAGQSVQAGQVIGYVGNTGRSFGAHLHFELYPPGVRYGDVYRAVNAQPWLSANGVQTR